MLNPTSVWDTFVQRMGAGRADTRLFLRSVPVPHSIASVFLSCPVAVFRRDPAPSLLPRPRKKEETRKGKVRREKVRVKVNEKEEERENKRDRARERERQRTTKTEQARKSGIPAHPQHVPFATTV